MIAELTPLGWVLLTADFIISIAIVLALYRMLNGPTVVDRIMAFDQVAISLVAFTALLSIQWHTAFFLELILIISSLGFFGTVAFVYYLMRTQAEREGESATLPSPSRKEGGPA